MDKKMLVAAVAVVAIVGGLVYYFMGSGYNYGAPNIPASPVTETPNSQGAYPVSMKNFAFDPAVLSIKVGDTVIWTNNDSAGHDVSGSGFKSPIMSNGQSYSYTFTSAGTFDYICAIHPSMKGQVIVE
jgi:amicyanin